MEITFYRKYGKRIFDFTASLFSLIVLSPVLLLTAILVKIKLGSPVLFRQRRPGLNETIFTIYKFRTLTDEKDGNGHLLPDKDRLTAFGRTLRSLSIDELPELFNILKGDMSFVGPRPLLLQYIPLYTEEQRKRHSVRPGLTGLAQVSGRNAIKWDDRFRLDCSYTDDISFPGDCRIILDTIKTVCTREGIHSKTAATMDIFTGSGIEVGKD